MQRMQKLPTFIISIVIVFSITSPVIAYVNNAPFMLLDESMVNLSDYQDKSLLIDAMATWCEVCKIEMGHLYDVQQVASDNVTIVTISVSPATDGISDMIKFKEEVEGTLSEARGETIRFNWDFGIDVDEVVIAHFGITTVPTTILLDQDGKVVKKWVGLVETQDMLKEIDENIEYTPPEGNLLLDSLLNNIVFQITIGLFVIAIVYSKLIPKKPVA